MQGTKTIGNAGDGGHDLRDKHDVTRLPARRRWEYNFGEITPTPTRRPPADHLPAPPLTPQPPPPRVTPATSKFFFIGRSWRICSERRRKKASGGVSPPSTSQMTSATHRGANGPPARPDRRSTADASVQPPPNPLQW